MNILMVADVSIKNVIGGAPRVLHEESKRLKQRGHNVWVLTRQVPNSDLTENIIEGVKELRYRIVGSNPLVYILSSFFNSRRLFEEIVRGKCFDVMNFHQPFSALGVNLSRKSKGIKKVYTFHSPAFKEYETRNKPTSTTLGRWYYKLNSYFRKRIERHSLKKCVKIRTLSEYMKRELLSCHGVADEKVIVIPGGVDTDRFTPSSDRLKLKKELRVPIEKTLLLSVRNLVPRMGLENLIYAMADVVKKTRNVYLIFGGEGALEERLKGLVEQLGLGLFVRFEGFIPENKLPFYYQAADLFVLPTKMLEGFGLVTVESLSCGTPVLGTPIGGTKEILAGLDTRLLFEGTEPRDISERILYFLNRQSELEDLRDKCRQFAVDNYSWDDVVQRLEKVFEKIAQQKT
ncbi:MAG: glycosyltransferase family 4 protein [Desulfobacterales bacterium]|nr:glycosyltransferase family 4 protein [Desulfobacterales bacterium]